MTSNQTFRSTSDTPTLFASKMTEMNKPQTIEAAIAIKRDGGWYYCDDEDLLQSLFSGILQGASKFGHLLPEPGRIDRNLSRSLNNNTEKSRESVSPNIYEPALLNNPVEPMDVVDSSFTLARDKPTPCEDPTTSIEVESSFKCQVCDRSFTHRHNLEAHFEAHFTRNERGYFICPIPDCPKIMSWKNSCKRHVRIHTGEKPYPCTQSGCGARFREITSLKEHSKVHTGVTTHICPHGGCGAKYNTFRALTIHWRRYCLGRL